LDEGKSRSNYSGDSAQKGTEVVKKANLFGSRLKSQKMDVKRAVNARKARRLATQFSSLFFVSLSIYRQEGNPFEPMFLCSLSDTKISRRKSFFNCCRKKDFSTTRRFTAMAIVHFPI
jgi:hypothetical protein